MCICMVRTVSIVSVPTVYEIAVSLNVYKKYTARNQQQPVELKMAILRHIQKVYF